MNFFIAAFDFSLPICRIRAMGGRRNLPHGRKTRFPDPGSNLSSENRSEWLHPLNLRPLNTFLKLLKRCGCVWGRKMKARGDPGPERCISCENSTIFQHVHAKAV